ncbi:M20/M25/M40 family metallo-hydrolase [Lysobacter pythonis]|uniref:M20/M25/M40 family metallo-hydrolase n=1 Tax=Solilutibacter pythonis TaxID=2483112 RepID=A0A3M2HNU9_9GAMM|nr:M28 family metallopeptidase [Lysobacter pythonis]RMH89009.1 M20/M25/M40 family metallo-hydrolase [Lysobacter pythonis]
MRHRHLFLGLAAVTALAACKPAEPLAAPAAGTSAPAPEHAFAPDINLADYTELLKTLASDEFEGRGPGTYGEEKSVDYIKAQFERIGLKPGNAGGWFQTVPMVVSEADPTTTMKIEVNGKPRELKFGNDMVVGTRTGEKEVKIDGSELVFVGYGVDAPEQRWNDYAGIDVKGKTVVMFVNDPGFHSQDENLFEGKRMTYYGRWTYKFEEAARKGAKAALIIHDDAGAAYGWEVVKNSWSGPQHDLPAKDDPAPRLPAQGWITGERAKALFADAGLDLDELRAAAGKRGFKAVPMKARLSLDLKSTTREQTSRNVVGILPGTEKPDEGIVYMAHWDHLGKHEGESGDNIYNGAVDNATGVAGIIEIAGKFAASSEKPKRSIVFLAVTLEESGLLGSKYYVAHPTIPMDKTVAVINMDAMPVGGRSKNMTVVGMGNSELEDLLADAAKAQNRVLTPESTPEDGFYFRSDHFNFAKAGVPALYAKGGDDLLEGGTEAGHAAEADYRQHRYHKPADQFDANWKLDGIVEDLQALYQVGNVVANDGSWPNWRAGSAFRATRDKMMAAKAKQP